MSSFILLKILVSLNPSSSCLFGSANRDSEIPDPAEYTGEVNVEDFWESVSLNIFSLGFVNGKTWISFVIELRIRTFSINI